MSGVNGSQPNSRSSAVSDLHGAQADTSQLESLAPSSHRGVVTGRTGFLGRTARINNPYTKKQTLTTPARIKSLRTHMRNKAQRPGTLGKLRLETANRIREFWLINTWILRNPRMRLDVQTARLKAGTAFLRASSYKTLEDAVSKYETDCLKVYERRLAAKPIIKVMTEKKRAELLKKINDINADYGDFHELMNEIDKYFAKLVQKFRDNVKICSHQDVSRLMKELRVLMNNIASDISAAADHISRKDSAPTSLIDVKTIIEDRTSAWQNDKSSVWAGIAGNCKVVYGSQSALSQSLEST